MCEDQGFAVQPQAPPAWPQLQEDLAQLAEESSDLASLRGKATKSSITNVLPWGHHSSYPWLPCHNTFVKPLLWCDPQRALLFPRIRELSLFYNPFPSSQSFSFLLWYLQSPEVKMLPGDPKETIWPTNLGSTGAGASRAAGQFHGHIRSHQAHRCPRYKRTASKITAQKQRWTQCFGNLGEKLFQEQHCRPLLPWEALRRPWNTRPNIIWIHGLESEVIVGGSKGVRAASPSAATCLSVPPNYPKVPLYSCFPTSSIFIREEVTWESSCPPTWKCRAHGENAALRACILPLTAATRAFSQTTNPRFNLPLYILAVVLQILAQLLRLLRLSFSKPNACQTSSARTRFLLGLWLMLIFKNREVGTSWSEMKLHFKHAEKAKLGQKLILPISDYLSKQASKKIINKLFEDTLDLSFPTGVFLSCCVLTLI